MALEPLVGVTAASRRLAIPPSNFRRDAAPHLNAIPVEGSAAVYFRSEVEELASRRRQARAERAERSNGDGPHGAGAVHQPGPNVENIRSSSQAKAEVAPVPKRGKRG